MEYVEILGYMSQFGQSELTAALRRANACGTYSAEAVLFHLRIAEQVDRSPTLATQDRWGLPEAALSKPNPQQYEELAS